MKHHTFKERLEAGLLADGWTKEHDPKGYRELGWTKRIDPTSTNKYRVFVGPAGGLCSGHSISNSHSIGHPTYQTKIYLRLLQLGDEQLMTAKEVIERAAAQLIAAAG